MGWKVREAVGCHTGSVWHGGQWESRGGASEMGRAGGWTSRRACGGAMDCHERGEPYCRPCCCMLW